MFGMIKKGLAVLGLTVSLTVVNAPAIQAAPSAEAAVVSVENCGAYLFEWRPIEYGSGRYFAILAGGDTIAEKDVILNRGYDYAYTFASASYPKPWGQAPQLVNMEGTWGIPENWHLLPKGSQPTLQIVLFTNNKNLAFKERYIDVVSLPKGVSASELPPEVRKYLINVDGSDAGAYQGTVTSGWIKENEQWKYRNQDGSFVNSSWLAVDGKQYYLNEAGVMLSDTMTPDGTYVNGKGERTNYIPGWKQDGDAWRYLTKNGSYATASWIQDSDGKWYYFDLSGRMVINDITPDGYYVDVNGVWDGQTSSLSGDKNNLGPSFS